MQTSATLLLQLPSPMANPKTTSSSIINYSPPTKQFFSAQRIYNNKNNNSISVCRASTQDSPITEFNLYELLGVDASCDRAQIKEAYRSLQKRCHPDIAGPAGHDMAIVLNEAYALLSDPNSRSAYDKELAKVADLQGYTGRPIYSVWLGPETEQRAVFVDEVKCVGCLKCALFAQKTFAIESVYGRARVVAQWADPEDTIREAIGACPVDCISIVERSNLAALEFIMSKQPRGKVGVRTADVFDEVEKFQARYAKHKASTDESKESDDHMASRISAIQAIQMITSWLYWQSPSSAGGPLARRPAGSTRKYDPASFKKLKAAAEARKQGTSHSRLKEFSANTNEYWVPLSLGIPETTTAFNSRSETKPRVRPSPTKRTKSDEFLRRKEVSSNPIRQGVPVGAAIVAATIVRLQIEGESAGGLSDHIGGSMLLAIVNSSWLQVVLAGFTWYFIVMYVVELLSFFRRK